MTTTRAGKLAAAGAAIVLGLLCAADCQAQYPAPAGAPAYQVVYYGGYVAPARTSYYNPVGFGFGGYSYGGYPAYGYNAYLPAAYAGFNTPGGFGPTPGGSSYFIMSDSYVGTCGPSGCRVGYRGW